MKDCIFCDIVKNANDEGQSQSVILYEDDLIIIVPAKGSPVEGYLMIIVKRHIKGKFYESANILNAPRSIFMNLIAKQIDIPLPYEWRTSETKNEYIEEMIEIFKNNKIQ